MRLLEEFVALVAAVEAMYHQFKIHLHDVEALNVFCVILVVAWAESQKSSNSV